MIEVKVWTADMANVLKQIQAAAAEALRRHKAGEPPLEVEDEDEDEPTHVLIHGELVQVRCPCEHQHLGQCPPS